MANVILQQGDVHFLNTVRLDTNTLKDLHLFKNDHVPVVTDIDLNYTEADFSGYASVGLGTWNPAFVNGDGKGEIDAAPASFVHSAGVVNNTIYGAYITDSAGHVMYAERFGAPIIMAANGDTLPYTPRLTAVSA
jgi:hypothetical protein